MHLKVILNVKVKVMKNLLLLFVLLFGLNAASLASDPIIESKKLISTDLVELSLNDSNQFQYFSTVGFNDQTNTIDINTMDDISYIQVFDKDGELQYQLPIMSNKVKLSKKMFDSGNYKLGFMFDGSKEIQFTSLTVN